MVRVIYGDVLLLVDFCMNCFALYITGYFISRRIKGLCLVGAALLGGIYSVTEVMLNTDNLFAKATSLAVGLLMCYVAFGGYKFIRTALIFFAVSALLGGLMYGVYYLLGSFHSDLFGNPRGYSYTHIPLWLFAVLAVVSFVLAIIFSRLGRDVTDKREAEIIVENKNEKCRLHVLIDSGNLVREPISGKYVILVDGEAAAPLLSADEIRALRDDNAEFLLLRRFRLICAAGVDGTRHMFYGFIPERMILIDGKHRTELDAYIAVSPSERVFGEFDGIVHPSLIA